MKARRCCGGFVVLDWKDGNAVSEMNASWCGRLLLMLCLIGFGSEVSFAQLFGRDRSIGQPLTRQPTSSNMEDVGQITGNERFLRQNRGRASFVGADQNEGQGFVGSQQAQTSGIIVSSTAGIETQPDRSSAINRPLKQPGKGEMYLPRIVLGLDRKEVVNRLPRGPDVNDRARRAVELASKKPIEVSVTARTARLRGWVESAYEKELIETLILFEPGISEVVNQLKVRTTDSLPPPPNPEPPRAPAQAN